jgi:hypothetical protein
MMTPRQWVLVVLILVACAAAVVGMTLLLATGQLHPVRPLTP